MASSSNEASQTPQNNDHQNGDPKSLINAQGSRKCSALNCADPASAKNLLSGTVSPGGNIKHIVVDYSNQGVLISSPRWNNGRNLVNSRQGSDHTIPGHHIVSINSTSKSSELMNQSMPKQNSQMGKSITPQKTEKFEIKERNFDQWCQQKETQDSGQQEINRSAINTMRILGGGDGPSSTAKSNEIEDCDLPNFGILTDREFQRRLAIQQANEFVEKRFGGQKPETIPHSSRVHPQNIDCSMEQRNIRHTDATPRSMASLPAREEQQKANSAGEQNESTTACFAQNTTRLEDMVDIYREQRTQAQQPKTVKVNAGLKEPILEKKIETIQEMQQQKNVEKTVVNLNPHGIATNEKISIAWTGDEQTLVVRDRSNTLLRPISNSSARSPAMKIPKKLQAPTQIEIVASFFDRNNGSGTPNAQDTHGNNLLINSERLQQNQPAHPLINYPDQLCGVSSVRSKQRTGRSISPQNSTFHNHPRAASKVTSPNSTIDDISVVGSQIDTRQKASSGTNQNSSRNQTRSALNSHKNVTKNNNNKNESSIFRRKSQSMCHQGNNSGGDNTPQHKKSQSSRFVNNPVLALDKNNAIKRKPQVGRDGVTMIPDCLKELVDYKNSQDYLMFKQLHNQLNSQYSRLKAHPLPPQQYGSRLQQYRQETDQTIDHQQRQAIAATAGGGVGTQSSQQCNSSIVQASTMISPRMESPIYLPGGGIKQTRLRNAAEVVQIQKIVFNVAANMKPESRSTREEISKNSRPKSAYRRRPDFSGVGETIHSAVTHSNSQMSSQKKLTTAVLHSTESMRESQIKPASLSNQGSQIRLMLGYPESQMGRSKYMPLSKVPRIQHQRYPNSVQSELEQVITNPQLHNQSGEQQMQTRFSRRAGHTVHRQQILAGTTPTAVVEIGPKRHNSVLQSSRYSSRVQTAAVTKQNRSGVE